MKRTIRMADGEVKELSQELLNSFRGKGKVCGCGKLLTPAMRDGKQIGLTHRSPGDEDYHIWYFTGWGLNPETNQYEEGFNPYTSNKPREFISLKILIDKCPECGNEELETTTDCLITLPDGSKTQPWRWKCHECGAKGGWSREKASEVRAQGQPRTQSLQVWI